MATDYGTGQSTLSYLKRVPAREIKIDESFVLALESSRADQAMSARRLSSCARTWHSHTNTLLSPCQCWKLCQVERGAP